MKVSQNELEISDNCWVKNADGEMFLFHSIVEGQNEVIYTDDSGRLILADYEDMYFFCNVCNLWYPMHMLSLDAFENSSRLFCKLSYENMKPFLNGGEPTDD